MTKIINLFAGPGAGKSTTAAGIFYELKQKGILIELVTEVAKDLVWSQRHQCIRCQPLIFGKQLYRIERLIDKVDYIVTDSPFLLSALYGQALYPASFITAVADIFKTFNNLNFFLLRNKPYVEVGRMQNETEAKGIDWQVQHFLDQNNIAYSKVGGISEILAQVGI